MNSKPLLLVLHGKRHFDKPTHAESDSVRALFRVQKAREIVGKPDVVYCQSFSQCSAELRKWGGPRMILVGGNPWHEFPLAGLSKRLPSFKDLFERQTVIACLSRFLAKCIAPRLKTNNVFHLPRGLWGVDHVNNGVKPARFRPKTSWKIRGRPTAITSIIMNDTAIKRTKWRGIPIFLSAVEKVAKKHNVWFLNSARGNHSFSMLRPWKKRWGFEFVKHHHLDEKHDHWPALLHSADIFFYPSTYDGWGRVVADAMCSALPSMVMRATAPPEIADTPIMFTDNPEDINKKFTQLLEDESYREEVGKTHLAEALKLTEKHRGDIARMLWLTMEKKFDELRKFQERR